MLLREKIIKEIDKLRFGREEFGLSLSEDKQMYKRTINEHRTFR